MNHTEIKEWKDLNNRSIIVKYNEKEYPGTFFIREERLILSIMMTTDIEEWRKAVNDIEGLPAYLIDNNRKITLINCMHYGNSSSGVDPIINAQSDYWIDRILLDYELENVEDAFINCISAEYDDICWITKERIYSQDIINDKIDINPVFKEYKLEDKDVVFGMLPSFAGNDYNMTISGNRGFNIKFHSNKTFDKALKYIYLIKNFLMVLGKRNIKVLNQEIIEGELHYRIIDCGGDKEYNKINIDLADHLNHRIGIKIEDFDDFDVVLNNFEREYDRLMPLLELYYNVVKYKVPNLTRFVNAITMLEYCSREFDDANALNKTIQKHQGKMPKNGADFVDRVISLIENINDVYKLDLNDIEIISKNIKDARTYYVHYEPSGKKLTDDQLIGYVYFIEDLIILNIYLIVGFDINKFANISYNEYFYNLDDLK